ncbi:hypothetical protein [Thiocapsa bogorovii]|uniref:hypothetical protein n=1 Tax=Thiocapsa bogorovii TaxID=521689 RepID=UPI001E3EDC23|nr:hypothetical protein [Thiocapsa bogorovii]UHD18700.1 hypothetical protein LT988_11980 [Thiocapsa bogorovii]
MTIRRPLSISPVNIALLLLVLAGAAYGTSVRADIDEVQPNANFIYETIWWNDAGIALASNDGNPALLIRYGARRSLGNGCQHRRSLDSE